MSYTYEDYKAEKANGDYCEGSIFDDKCKLHNRYDCLELDCETDELNLDIDEEYERED